MKIPGLTEIKKYLSRPKPIQNTDHIRTLTVKKENIQLISCSNVIIRIKTNDTDGFLCECRLHLPILQYVEQFVHVFFSCFCDDSADTAIVRKMVLDSIKNPDNLRKFTDIGKSNPYTDSPYLRYLQTGNGKEIGLNLSSANERQKRHIRRFVEKYAWPQLAAYYANTAGRGEYNTCSSNKVLATEAMARLIGLESTIPHAEYVKVCVTDADNCVIIGSFMESAKGVCAMDIPPESRLEIITPGFQCAMLNLANVCQA